MERTKFSIVNDRKEVKIITTPYTTGMLVKLKYYNDIIRITNVYALNSDFQTKAGIYIDGVVVESGSFKKHEIGEVRKGIYADNISNILI